MLFLMTITHSQINVFDEQFPDFNNWTEEHVAQGFSWRKGHVSFGVPDHDGSTLVDVRAVDEFPPLSDAVNRVIKVPFLVSSRMIVATIIDDAITDIKKSSYQLEFRLLDGNLRDQQYPHSLLVELFLKEDISPIFEIVRRDGEMTTDSVLTTKADPA